jgi:hypothetical protein
MVEDLIGNNLVQLSRHSLHLFSSGSQESQLNRARVVDKSFALLQVHHILREKWRSHLDSKHM